MFLLSVNSKEYCSNEDKKLLTFLRDDLHLTGTKDGCSEGACGACTVIVDGKATRACVFTLSKLQGKKIKKQQEEQHSAARNSNRWVE